MTNRRQEIVQTLEKVEFAKFLYYSKSKDIASFKRRKRKKKTRKKLIGIQERDNGDKFSLVYQKRHDFIMIVSVVIFIKIIFCVISILITRFDVDVVF